MMKYLKKLKSRAEVLVLDSEEKRFLNSLKKNQKAVLIEIKPEHWYVRSFKYLIEKITVSDEKLIGFWPSIVPVLPKNEGELSIKLKKLYSFLLKSKWQRIYKGIGVAEVLKTNGLNKFNQHAEAVFEGLISKRDVLLIKYEDIDCGDLIYDSYLRFRVTETVDIDDTYLKDLITICFNLIDTLKQAIKTKNITKLILSYSSYINHGIPARVGLSMGCDVYCDGAYLFYAKKLSKADKFHTVSWKEYKSIDDGFDQRRRESNRKTALKSISKRLKGETDTGTWYMRQSAFDKAANDYSDPVSFEGVIFLHDFFDSPHIYGECLYEDFYEWITATLRVLSPISNKVAIKVHPNSLVESLDVVAKLKKAYPGFVWLDSSVSNIFLFQNMKWGISVYGTVLSEMAFNETIAISAGEHPGQDFNFCYNPKSILEYEALLKNVSNLEGIADVRNKALDYLYIHLHYPKDYFEPFMKLESRLEYNDSRILNI